MTVSTVASGAVFLGNGSTTVFSANINNGVPFNSNTSLASYTVIYTNASGTQTTLSPSVYSLSFTAAVTGALWGIGVQLTYPLTGSPIASGTSLTLNRVFALQQLTSISNQGDFAPQNIEAMGDIEEMQLQQIAARTAQQRGVWAVGVQYNNGDIVIDGVNGANTGNYYSCAIPNVSSVWATDLAAGDWSLAVNIQIIAGYAATASAAATTATTEAGISTTQAGIATTAATTATTQAGIATTQATNAATSATSAANSATSATTSASTASTAATSASSSATSATSSASTATTQAGIATTQAGIATTQAGIATTAATAAGSTLNSTSTTSNTIGTGNFTFTTQAGKNYLMGQPIIAASAANGSNYIHGYVNSYSGTTLIITETDTGGSGAHADWNIAVTGTQGPSGGGTGTVTTASVVSANGLAGTVANPTTTPAITLSTSVTGVLKGNGTAISAATPGTDYLTVLTGDVTTSGNAATLATVNSNVGTFASATFNGKGLATAAANLTGDITSSGAATTLATVNSNVGSFTAANITVNAKGLITAASNGSSGTGRLLNVQSFSSSGTYTKTVGTNSQIIKAWGAGGGSGAGAGAGGTTVFSSVSASGGGAAAGTAALGGSGFGGNIINATGGGGSVGAATYNTSGGAGAMGGGGGGASGSAQAGGFPGGGASGSGNGNSAAGGGYVEHYYASALTGVSVTIGAGGSGALGGAAGLCVIYEYS